MSGSKAGLVVVIVVMAVAMYGLPVHSQIDDENCILYSFYFTAESATTFFENGKSKDSKSQKTIDAQAAFAYSLLGTNPETEGYNILSSPHDVWKRSDPAVQESFPEKAITDIFPQCPMDLLNAIQATNPTCAHRGSGFYLHRIETEFVDEYGVHERTEQRTMYSEYDTLWVCSDDGKYIITSFFRHDKRKYLEVSEIDSSKPQEWLVVKLDKRFHKHHSLTAPIEDSHLSFVRASCYSEEGESVVDKKPGYKLYDIVSFALQPYEQVPVSRGLPIIYGFRYWSIENAIYECEEPFSQIWSNSADDTTDTASGFLSVKDSENLIAVIMDQFNKYPDEELDAILAANPTAAYRHKVQFNLIMNSEIPEFNNENQAGLPDDMRASFDIISIDTRGKVYFLVYYLYTWSRKAPSSITALFKGMREGEKAFFIIETDKIVAAQ